MVEVKHPVIQVMLTVALMRTSLNRESSVLLQPIHRLLESVHHQQRSSYKVLLDVTGHQ